MSHQTLARPVFSFTDIMRAPSPREAIEKRLIEVLTVGLKKLKIMWNQGAFLKGLQSPELPRATLKKLETVLFLAETLDWRLSKNVKDELDATIEDIESFNPIFRERMREATKDFATGRFTTHRELIKRDKKSKQ